MSGTNSAPPPDSRRSERGWLKYQIMSFNTWMATAIGQISSLITDQTVQDSAINTAQNKADQAYTNAATAQTTASAAGTSASAAQAAASSASTAAQAAQATANTASNTATTASNSAASAQATASAASTLATSVQNALNALIASLPTIKFGTTNVANNQTVDLYSLVGKTGFGVAIDGTPGGLLFLVNPTAITNLVSTVGYVVGVATLLATGVRYQITSNKLQVQAGLTGGRRVYWFLILQDVVT